MAFDNELDQVRFNRVHRSLQRRNLLMGCEPEALISLVGLVAFLTVVAPRPPTFMLGLLVLFGGIALLRQMARRDPHMIAVLIRHFRYQNEYQPWPSMATPPVKPVQEKR